MESPCFDRPGAVSYTLGLVRRVTAALAGLALILTTGPASGLHIHAYADHDHPEHHHGPAPHDHGPEHRAAVASPDDTSHVEGCDPSWHALSLTFVCAAPPQSHTADAESVTLAVIVLAATVAAAIAVTDVRAHGPPSLTQAPPRAPPPIVQA